MGSAIIIIGTSHIFVIFVHEPYEFCRIHLDIAHAFSLSSSGGLVTQRTKCGPLCIGAGPAKVVPIGRRADDLLRCERYWNNQAGLTGVLLAPVGSPASGCAASSRGSSAS